MDQLGQGYLSLGYYYNDMTDIVNVNIGQAGTRIGHLFWKTLRQEHAIDQTTPNGRMSFFEQKSKGYESRSIFIDLDQREIDKLKAEKDSLYNQRDLISYNATSRGLYAESAYHIFPEMQEEIMERISRRVQACDSLSGFIIISSMGGGTSSGLGNCVSQKIKESYPCNILQTFKHLPDISMAHPLEIFNSAHSIYCEVECSDLTLLFDNAWAERSISRQTGGVEKGIEAVNKWIAGCIAESTVPFRFSGSLNTSQRKIATNMVLFPRLHFMPFATGPTLTAALKPDALSLSNFYSVGDKAFTIYTGVRDPFCSQQETDTCVRNQLQRHRVNFVEWLQPISHLSLHDPVSRPSATFMINSYNMKQYYNLLSQRFTATHRRSGFQCWYRGVGLDSMEFTEIQSNLNDLVSEYTPYEYYNDEVSYQSDEAQ